MRLAACAGDCIDADGKKSKRMVTIRQGGVRDAQELLLEAFQTGSFYGPLSWNSLFDARLFKEKGIHYDETMLFGDDASVLHRVFEGERCNCLTDVLYHYRTRAGRSQRRLSAAQDRRPADVLGVAAILLGPSRARGVLRLGRCAVLEDLLPVLVPVRCGGQPARGQAKVYGAQKSIWMPFCPYILASKYLPLGEEAAGCRVLRQPHADLRRGGCLGTLHTRKGK